MFRVSAAEYWQQQLGEKWRVRANRRCDWRYSVNNVNSTRIPTDNMPIVIYRQYRTVCWRRFQRGLGGVHWQGDAVVSCASASDDLGNTTHHVDADVPFRSNPCPFHLQSSHPPTPRSTSAYLSTSSHFSRKTPPILLNDRLCVLFSLPS